MLILIFNLYYMTPYKPPTFEAKAFNCPHCNAYAKQTWCSISFYLPNDEEHNYDFLKFVICDHCNMPNLWMQEELIFPVVSGVPLPNEDLEEDIKDDYLEAANIINQSPRGAVAILRLCVQKVCKQVGEHGKNINDDIASLVKKGLPVKIQQALDVVRVVGNNAVHPGQIDLSDNIETAYSLFTLVNLIAEAMISQPKHVASLYDSLPTGAIEAIQKRDSPK